MYSVRREYKIENANTEQHKLLKYIMSNETDFREVLDQSNAVVSFSDLGLQIKALVYISSRGKRHIIINSTLTNDQLQQLLIHKLKYILSDFPKNGCIIV